MPFVIATATVALGVGAGTLMPAEYAPSPIDVFGADKLLHLGAWALLGALLVGALWPHGHGDRAPRSRVRRAAWLAWLLAVGYGVGVEVVQRAVPGRSAELADLVADALGAALGVAFALAVARRIHTRRAEAPPAPRPLPDTGASSAAPRSDR